MPMTTQQLMDLSGYGSAEKQLRKDGRWKLTPQEKIEKMLDLLSSKIDEVEDAISDAQYELSKLYKQLEGYNQCN